MNDIFSGYGDGSGYGNRYGSGSGDGNGDGTGIVTGKDVQIVSVVDRDGHFWFLYLFRTARLQASTASVNCSVVVVVVVVVVGRVVVEVSYKWQECSVHHVINISHLICLFINLCDEVVEI